MNIQKHLDLLGLRVKDRVTGLEGVVTSIDFDLYGCIQAALHPGLDKDNKPLAPLWYDVSRLEILDPTPVMQRPNFVEGSVAEGKQGAAEKPTMGKV